MLPHGPLWASVYRYVRWGSWIRWSLESLNHAFLLLQVGWPALLVWVGLRGFLGLWTSSAGVQTNWDEFTLLPGFLCAWFTPSLFLIYHWIPRIESCKSFQHKTSKQSRSVVASPPLHLKMVLQTYVESSTAVVLVWVASYKADDQPSQQTKGPSQRLFPLPGSMSQCLCSLQWEEMRISIIPPPDLVRNVPEWV